MNHVVLTLKALPNETCFQIIDPILPHDLRVGALPGHSGIFKAAISQHLHILRKAGV